MFNLELAGKIWLLFVGQIPFLICAAWILPKNWKKIKTAFTEKVYHQLWLVVLFNFAAGLLLGLLLSPQMIPEQVKMFHSMGPLLSFLLVCIIAPLVEECFFRGLIFDNFEKNNLLPYLLSFFGFMLMHLGWFIFAFSWIGILKYLIFYGIFSFYLICIYRLSGWNLAFPIAAHFFNNLIVFIIVFTRYKVS
ncbi:CPBP family intramembrane glutamic endopeptidase [endosymbiont GvMRE of Glomus versiforme]|uniref:CPBP family intramembrane glutamic endopeptidase n=1 Tax=endosymbiont GvMRE of Glomus versiforme TaxID=2039283 RepID=UPI000EE5B9D6|nr:CPBP family intramembrane glutamic endopeptidase [endosymbiont GvMRE of Glomus versiforme]RHZ36953.1 CAAX amino terminal protease family protein [endosymbiont GvMRE of Glomus versiforme]